MPAERWSGPRCNDRDSERFVDAVKIENGRLTIAAPRPRSPLDQLAPELIRIHYAGIIRALASALDCLAGAVIGVAALPISILKADLGKARAGLGKISGAANDGAKMQAQSQPASKPASPSPVRPDGSTGRSTCATCWSIAGEELNMVSTCREPLFSTGADALPVLRARRVAHLPRDPGRSDVEVFLDTPWTLVLSEEGDRTLQGLVDSTKALLETTARDLIKLWRWRRQNPQSLRQPAAQWRDGRSTKSTGFNGYAPGTLKLAPAMAMVHPVVARRIHAAALDDPARPQWATFD